VGSVVMSLRDDASTGCGGTDMEGSREYVE
jgi:hypothetical protein